MDQNLDEKDHGSGTYQGDPISASHMVGIEGE